MCQSEMELAVGKKKTPKKKKRKMGGGEEGEAPGWIEVLIDMLLGFLSQPSQLWRNVTEQVCVCVCVCVGVGILSSSECCPFSP